MKTKPFILGLITGIALMIAFQTIAKETEDLSFLSDECLNLLLECENRTLEEQTAHQETLDNLDTCTHSWEQCQAREVRYLQTIAELELQLASKQIELDERKSNPIPQFGLTYGFNLSYGTSLLFQITPRLYLYKGLNLFLNAGISYGQYGQYNTIPDFIGTIGLGYTLY